MPTSLLDQREMDDFIWRAIVIFITSCLLAYFVPGLILRAIKDFKNRYKKGAEADGKNKIET